MPITIDYQQARDLLNNVFLSAEQHIANGTVPPIDPAMATACDEVFRSNTQAYREVLLGCIVAKTLAPLVNVRKPYANQGDDALNGRTLDEQVVNRMLKASRVPSSGGPYLSVFRRSVQFVPSTREGLRDKLGYDALLRVLEYVESASKDDLQQLLRFYLYRFGKLREEASVPLARPGRISLEQYDTLLSRLLASPSGGRFPLLFVVAAFTTLNDVFQLGWTIDHQGINVADAASGVGGDITIRAGEKVVLAAEVTERVVVQSRVVTTFQAKILPAGIEDYLFFIRLDAVQAEARHQAQRYFAQGHEVNFLVIEQWILMLLGTMGGAGRDRFTRVVIGLFSTSDVPTYMKVAWNQQVERLTAL